jgi:hypothetical protein
MAMSATDEQIARLRRMANESGTTTYTDKDLAQTIERYPLVDERGEEPWEDSETTPGTLEANEDWLPTYDLNSAAADIWQEKAAPGAQDYDFAADGGSYTRSQAFAQAMQMVRYFRSRRSLKVVLLRPEPYLAKDEALNA